MHRPIYRMFSWLVISLLCMGCFKPPAQQPKPRIYVLTAPRFCGEKSPALDAGLAVAPFKAAVVLRTTRMLKQSGNQIELTSNHLWGAPPALLLTDYLTRFLESSGRFTAVWQAGQLERPDFILTGFVDSFQAAAVGRKWEAVLGASVTLSANSPNRPQPRIIFQKYYRVAKPIADASPQALAKAMTEAALTFSRMLTGDVAKAAGDAIKGEK